MEVKVSVYHKGDKSSEEVIFLGDNNKLSNVNITLEQLESVENEVIPVQTKEGIKETKVRMRIEPIYAEVGKRSKEYILIPNDVKEEDIKLHHDRV